MPRGRQVQRDLRLPVAQREGHENGRDKSAEPRPDNHTYHEAKQIPLRLERLWLAGSLRRYMLQGRVHRLPGGEAVPAIAPLRFGRVDQSAFWTIHPSPPLANDRTEMQ